MSAAAPSTKAGRADYNVARADRVALADRPAAAAQHRMDARRQFFGVVRLTDEIVGAGEEVAARGFAERAPRGREERPGG